MIEKTIAIGLTIKASAIKMYRRDEESRDMPDIGRRNESLSGETQDRLYPEARGFVGSASSRSARFSLGSTSGSENRGNRNSIFEAAQIESCSGLHKQGISYL